MNTIELNTTYTVTTRNFVQSANIDLHYEIVNIEEGLFTKFHCVVKTSDNRNLEMIVSCFAPNPMETTIYQIWDLVLNAYDNKEYTTQQPLLTFEMYQVTFEHGGTTTMSRCLDSNARINGSTSCTMELLTKEINNEPLNIGCIKVYHEAGYGSITVERIANKVIY